jgi:hypothetical protein
MHFNWNRLGIRVSAPLAPALLSACPAQIRGAALFVSGDGQPLSGYNHTPAGGFGQPNVLITPHGV